MAAESEGVDYYPGLLLPGRLAHGISSLEVGLDATEIEPILTWHTKEQKELKTRFDLPFSEDERGIATGLLDELEPLKEPDRYALRDTILARFPESKKEITLSTIGRLSIRQVIKTGTRTTRHRGTFRFVKWHTPRYDEITFTKETSS